MLEETGVARPYLERSVIVGVLASVKGQPGALVAEEYGPGTRVDSPEEGTSAITRVDGHAGARLGRGSEAFAVASGDDLGSGVALAQADGMGRDGGKKGQESEKG